MDRKAAYIVLDACSLCHALYLNLVSSLETQGFILSLKKFIARKGRPHEIYFENGSRFVGAAGWLRKTMIDENLSQFLTQNLSHAPWWGEQFWRVTGLVKNTFKVPMKRKIICAYLKGLSKYRLQFLLTQHQWPNCCHGNSTKGVIFFLLWCTFMVPSFKSTASIFPEISFIQYFPHFSCKQYDVITDQICIIEKHWYL